MTSSNLDKWISEYPQNRTFILSRRTWFESNPLPTDDEKELAWQVALMDMGLVDESGKLTGSE